VHEEHFVAYDSNKVFVNENVHMRYVLTKE